MTGASPLFVPRSTAGLKWVCLSLIMCFCSVLSKEQGITAVAVCLTYDVFIARNVSHYNLLMQTKFVMSTPVVCIYAHRFVCKYISWEGESLQHAQIHKSVRPPTAPSHKYDTCSALSSVQFPSNEAINSITLL